MSSHDNLYSADESDRDSFSDELTPADGYFNRGQRMSSNETVQDPSVEDSKPEPKTLIAPPHERSTGGPSRSSLNSVFPQASSTQRYASSPPLHLDTSPAPVIYSPPSPTDVSPTENMYSEQSPLVSSGPPPAYSPTPAPVSVPQQVIEQRYSTFPEEERGFLHPLREPQSMGGPTEVVFDESSPLARHPRSRVHKVIKKFRKIASKALLVLLVFVGMFTVLTYFNSNRSPNPGNLPIEGSPISDRPVDAEGPYCPVARLRDDIATYEFSTGAELTMIQDTYNNDGWTDSPVSTVGEIRLRRIPKDSKHGGKPYFTIDVHVSDPELEVLKTWDQDSKSLKISTPRYAKLSGYGRHCISLEITAWFPEDSMFTNLQVQAMSLTLRVMDDIRVDVSGRSKFYTVSGNVCFPTVDGDSLYTISDNQETETPTNSSSIATIPFSSRRLLVETISGNIKGAYPLEDLLGISSQSGSVNVKVMPRAVDDSAPAPADLEIQTSSGSIKAFIPVRSSGHPNFTPPARNYITRVHSTSGSISGSYYIGSETTFKSNSGSVRITTLPVLQSDASGSFDTKKNIFETHTLSGTTEITIQDPIFISPLDFSGIGNGDPYRVIPSIDKQPLFKIDSRASDGKTKLHSLKSSHATTSATVKVHYPDAWEGTIHGKTVSGAVDLKGEGIRIIKTRKGPGYTEVLAQRGVQEKADGCTIEMNSISGSLRFDVGVNEE